MQTSFSRTAGSRPVGVKSGTAGTMHVRAPSRQQLVGTSSRGQRLVAAAELDPDNASILVCGGGGVALSVTRKLKDMGSWVWMLQRTDERRKEIEGMMAIVAKGDALDRASVDKVFAGIEDVDAVVSTVGGSVANAAADGTGNINIIEAAASKGIKKFVLVTSVGCGDSKDAPGEQVYKVLEPVLLEKNKAEEKLKSLSGKFAYTIIRPGGLQSEPATGSGVLTEDTGVCGSISREDTADLVVKALFSNKADNKVLTAVDKNKLMTSKPFDTFTL